MQQPTIDHDEACSILASPIIFPCTNEAQLRVTCAVEGGDRIYKNLMHADLENMNHRDAAVSLRNIERKSIRRVRFACWGLEWRQWWAGYLRDAEAPDPDQPPRWIRYFAALCYSSVAAFGAVISNELVCAYILDSRSDLFANNPIGARLFATVPLIAAIALKVFEHRLVSFRAKCWYARIIFVVGVLGLAGYITFSALLFAPSVDASTDLLAASGDNKWLGIGIVLSTALCDVAVGYVLFSHAARLLAGRKRVASEVNPRWAMLNARKITLERELTSRRNALAMAEDYLARFKEASVIVGSQAELDLSRAREIYHDMQQGALSDAAVRFFAPKPPENRS